MFWDHNATRQKPFRILHAVILKDASATRESSRWTEECVGVTCWLFISFSSAELVYGSLGIEYGLR